MNGNLRRLKSRVAGLGEVCDDGAKDSLETFPVRVPHLLLAAEPEVFIGKRQVVGQRYDKGVA